MSAPAYKLPPYDPAHVAPTDEVPLGLDLAHEITLEHHARRWEGLCITGCGATAMKREDFCPECFADYQHDMTVWEEEMHEQRLDRERERS